MQISYTSGSTFLLCFTERFLHLSGLKKGFRSELWVKAGIQSYPNYTTIIFTNRWQSCENQKNFWVSCNKTYLVHNTSLSGILRQTKNLKTLSWFNSKFVLEHLHKMPLCLWLNMCSMFTKRKNRLCVIHTKILKMTSPCVHWVNYESLNVGVFCPHAGSLVW